MNEPEILEPGERGSNPSLPAPAESAPVTLTETEAAVLAELRVRILADGTRKTYESAWRQFEAWHEQRFGTLPQLPIDPVAILAYVAFRAPSVSTGKLSVDLSAINAVHREHGHAIPVSDPRLRELLSGHRRATAGALKQAAALRISLLEKVLPSEGSISPRAIRDRALFLTGFSGALRRSELGALHVSDLGFEAEGIRCRIRKSKTNQTGKAESVALVPARADRAHLCPVRAIRRWLDLLRQESSLPEGDPWLWCAIDRHGNFKWASSEAATGLTGHSIVDILRERAEQAGIDATRISGHSFRRGWITEAAMAGAQTREIMAQSRHTDIRVMERYVDEVAKLGKIPRVL